MWTEFADPPYVLIVMSDPTQITKLEEYKTQINAATVANDEDGDLMSTVVLANAEVKLFQESKRTCNKFIPVPKKKARTTAPAAWLVCFHTSYQNSLQRSLLFYHSCKCLACCLLLRLNMWLIDVIQNPKISLGCTYVFLRGRSSTSMPACMCGS